MLLQKIKGCCLLAFFFLIALFTGCEKHFDSIEEYEKYVKSEDSPYAQTIARNGVKVTLRYLPTDVLMINQLKTFEKEKIKTEADTSLSEIQKKEWIKKEKDELAKYRKSYNNGLHFMLTLAYVDESRDIVYDKGKAGFENYSEWLQKLLFKLDQYIYINSETEGEIPPSLTHLERSYGMYKHSNILIQFPKSTERDVEIVIKEFGLGTGRLEFEFKNLSDSPKLISSI